MKRTPQQMAEDVAVKLLQSGADFRGLAMVLEIGAVAQDQSQLRGVIARAKAAKGRLDEIIPTLERILAN